MYQFVTQAVGILGAVITILSFQFKDNRRYYTAQALGGLCFAINFFMLGAYTGSLLNLINVGRGFGFAVEKGKKPNVTLVSVCALYVLATVFTFDGALSVVACAAQLIGSFAMWTRKPGPMRVLQFFLVSPMWLVYNGFVGAVGGLICETFNMISVAVYFIRMKFFPKQTL